MLCEVKQQPLMDERDMISASPKFKKGDYSVREVKVDCTYGMYMHFFGVYFFLNEKNSLQMHLLRG